MTSSITSKLRDTRRALRGLRLAWAASPSLLLGNTVLFVLQGTLPLLGLYFAAQAVDAIVDGITTQGPSGALNQALFWISLAAGVAVVMAVVSSLSAVSTEILSLAVGDHVADQLHRKSLTVDLAFYEDPSFHDTLHRAQQDAAHRPAATVTGLLQLMQNIASLLAISAILMTLEWWMAGALILAAAPGLFVRVRFSEKLFGWRREVTVLERRAWYHHWLLTAPSWAAEQRVLGIGDLFRGRYMDLRKRLREGRLALGRRRAVADAIAQGVGAAVVFGVFAYLARDAVAGAISVGTFVLAFQAFQRGLSALQGLLGGLAGLWENGLFLQWLEDFLTLEPKVLDPPDPRPVPQPVTEGITVSDLGFRYRDAQAPVLEDISFQLAPGEVVALVGPNGSGKTTLVKLLLRLYDPDTGAIRIDDTDLRQMSVSDVRRSFAVLLQGFGSYAFTARENVWLGDIEAPEDKDRIEQAAQHSGADDEIDRLPRGWDTVVGTWFEDGRDLSAGQWQKLALARTFYRDAPFVILDEPTSALDPLAEKDLFEGFRRLVDGRTALYISHRLSLARQADRVLVLDQGRLVEQGPHEELLAAGGTYAKLWEASRMGELVLE